MNRSLLKGLSITANGAVIAGAILIICNFAGLFSYTTIEGNEIPEIDDRPRTVSEQQFWEQAYKRDGENTEDYVSRLAKLIDGRMIAIDPTYAIPTFFENWIMWIRAKHVDYQEWVDTRMAVRLGGGYCSQHAIVMDNLLDEQGIESRILGLGGHVINEVLVDGKWRVYDPLFGVTFNDSLNELERAPVKVYQTYLQAGRPDASARYWEEVYETPENNWHFRSSLAYSGMNYFMLEKLSYKLIWLIPVFLVLSGLIVKQWLRHITRTSRDRLPGQG